MIQRSERHRSGADPYHRPARPNSDATVIEHAVIQALLRAGLEMHSALSMVGAGVVADRLHEALKYMDEAICEVRREVAQRLSDTAD